MILTTLIYSRSELLDIDFRYFLIQYYETDSLGVMLPLLYAEIARPYLLLNIPDK